MNAINPILLPGKSFDLETFTYNGHTLRTVLIDGKPWFSALDAAAAINLNTESGSARRFLGALDQDECRHLLRSNVKTADVSFPNRGLNMISESGLYKFIMRAQRSNPAAREFQDWVTKEVLPRIRRDGAYIMGEEKVATGENCAGHPKEARTAPPCATR